MKNHLILLALVFITSSTLLSAQSQKIRFKKVSKEELQREACPYQESAHAEYLYHSVSAKSSYSDVRKQFVVNYYVHDRIKIYDKKGFNKADIWIPYRTFSSSNQNDEVGQIEAYTFNLKDGEVEKVKLKKDNIYEEQYNDFVSLIKFPMPAVEEGSVLDIRYSIEANSVFQIKEFYFQEDIPINFAYFKTVLPEFYSYNPVIKGIVPLKTKEDTEVGKFFTYNSKSYEASEVRGVEEEPFVLSMNNYKSSIHLELESYQYPAQPVEYITKSWNDIAQLIDELDGGGKVLRNNLNQYDEFIEGLTGMSEKKKMDAIYSRVQSDFNWNGYTSVVGGRSGLKDLENEGEGNNAIINLVLCNLLIKAGMNAKPIAYKKKSSGFLNLSYPTLYDLNYLIAHVQIGDKSYYLDATDKHTASGELPPRAINFSGVLLDRTTGNKITFDNPNQENINMMINLEIKDQKLSGNQAIRYSNYAAYRVRSTYPTESVLKESYGGENIEYKSLEVSNFDAVSKPISLKAEVNTTQGVSEVDGKLFLDPISLFADIQVPFVKEKREYSIFYESKLSENIIFKIKIPDGYKVESLPEELNISTPNHYISATIITKEMNNEIIITYVKSINETIIPPQYYSSVREVLSLVEAKAKEKIVLSKI